MSAAAATSTVLRLATSPAKATAGSLCISSEARSLLCSHRQRQVWVAQIAVPKLCGLCVIRIGSHSAQSILRMQSAATSKLQDRG